MVLNTELGLSLLESVLNMNNVTGYTHDFYRYPARFSPAFARTVIELFTKPGDWVFDPFMGGGTSLVEASLIGRNAIGTDISSLAAFLSTVKTTSLSEIDIDLIVRWADKLPVRINLHSPPIRDIHWISYQRNISSKRTWPIRKTVELMLAHLDLLPENKQRQFLRCVILRTTQWALDCRDNVPCIKQFRQQFFIFLQEMIERIKDYTAKIQETKTTSPICLHRSVIGIEEDSNEIKIPTPKLIVTSPPYPGVHVLYHRWQIHGRKETPAPFWIADCLDGNPTSYYTMGSRKQKDLVGYFDQLEVAFQSIKSIVGKDTTIVQLVAFSDPSWQLERYLQTLERVGLVEIKFPEFANSKDERLWRSIPNRKWYAQQKGDIGPSKEVALFHFLK